MMELDENKVKQFSKPNPRLQITKRNGTFKCPLCEKVKNSHSQLKVHVGTSHYLQQVEQFCDKSSTNCIICGNTFRKIHHLVMKQRVSEYLRNHSKMTSQILLGEGCYFCDFMYKNENTLKYCK